jgi:hypothetical protein
MGAYVMMEGVIGDPDARLEMRGTGQLVDDLPHAAITQTHAALRIDAGCRSSLRFTVWGR